ncbi:MAG: hypothetical protein ACUVTU_11790 [Desulfurispora sp.]|uniref:hypothetical protein n=1 Tax=Desulfurispora sp. TaxID=3014275 RepID=UPI00404B4F5A
MPSLWGGGPGGEARERRPVAEAPAGRDRAVGTAGRSRENGGAVGESGTAAGAARSETAPVRRPGGRNRVLFWDPRLAGETGNNRQG